MLHYLWRPRSDRNFDTKLTVTGSTEYIGCQREASSDSVRRTQGSGVKIGWLNVQSINNKATTVRELIEERKYDVFVATETWHHKGDSILKHASGPAYSISEHSREIGRGGGVAIFYRTHYSCSPILLPSVTTLEYVSIRLKTGRNAFAVLATYRPGSDRPTSLFYEELTLLLEVIILQA